MVCCSHITIISFSTEGKHYYFCLQFSPPLYTRDRNGQKTGTEMLLWSVSEVVQTQHPQRSNHRHKKVSIYLIVLLLSFFLPLMFLCSVPVQGVGFQSWGQSDTTLVPDLTACFHKGFKSELSVISPSRAVTFVTHTCIHGSVLLCSVNGWLLLTLITWSRCFSIWSIPGPLSKDKKRVKFTSSTAKQAMESQDSLTYV